MSSAPSCSPVPQVSSSDETFFRRTICPGFSHPFTPNSRKYIPKKFPSEFARGRHGLEQFKRSCLCRRRNGNRPLLASVLELFAAAIMERNAARNFLACTYLAHSNDRRPGPK